MKVKNCINVSENFANEKEKLCKWKWKIVQMKRKNFANEKEKMCKRKGKIVQMEVKNCVNGSEKLSFQM